ncbi:hypothetical protein BU14_0031s0097 [Porphyra umbilicalis]|uniref:Uncharacterized protein n=1 Tax=Porphyra umbilicalis TaxID=2786 RepID=A0A1X6PJP3_PORUM|nr:hypothetical protein BU14_0031s0097 [Porphyra umbilicalis]|eukprot:OSX80928.1 hypothetical protein BU14_0031s0097 [Porphyra umbilicalis]
MRAPRCTPRGPVQRTRTAPPWRRGRPPLGPTRSAGRAGTDGRRGGATRGDTPAFAAAEGGPLRHPRRWGALDGDVNDGDVCAPGDAPAAVYGPKGGRVGSAADAVGSDNGRAAGSWAVPRGARPHGLDDGGLFGAASGSGDTLWRRRRARARRCGRPVWGRDRPHGLRPHATRRRGEAAAAPPRWRPCPTAAAAPRGAPCRRLPPRAPGGLGGRRTRAGSLVYDGRGGRGRDGDLVGRLCHTPRHACATRHGGRAGRGASAHGNGDGRFLCGHAPP